MREEISLTNDKPNSKQSALRSMNEAQAVSLALIIDHLDSIIDSSSIADLRHMDNFSEKVFSAVESGSLSVKQGQELRVLMGRTITSIKKFTAKGK